MQSILRRSRNASSFALLACLVAVGAAGWGAHAHAVVLSHYPDPIMHDGYEAIASGPFNDADAARFLAQATFGPTTADIADLRAKGYQGWLDAQFGKGVSTQVAYLNWVEGLATDNSVTDDTRLESWAINAVGTPDPSRATQIPNTPRGDLLRQRIAFALSEIFVVSNSNGTLAYEPWSLASFYDLLATDAFVNYRTLLEDVTKHPAMGIFLSMIQNFKADPGKNTHPDQNYAREILQLFSVGLVQLDPSGRVLNGTDGKPAPTYTQTTVEGFAAVFTGWNWNSTSCNAGQDTCCDADTYFYCGPGGYDDVLWQKPMQAIEEYHDHASSKQLLKYGALTGILAPAAAQAEMTAALDNIFNHPNVGPFIARQLIQRLVTSNPTPEYVGRVAAAFVDDGTAQHVRGNLKAVISAILLDPEARFGQWKSPSTFGKLREPMLKITHLWRAMDAASAHGRIGTLSTYPPLEDWYGQAPLRAPTVFNFYAPTFRQSGEPQVLNLFTPEFQILTDTMVVATPNNLYHVVFCDYTGSADCYGSDDDDSMQTNDARDAALAMSNPAQLIQKYNLLFLSGQMSPAMQNILLTRLNAITSGNRGASAGISRVQHALYLILNSPEYSIQK